MSTEVAHIQAGSSVRFEWGLAGALALVRPGDVAVVVDVLSFTTAVSVAADRGIAVVPYRWADDGAGRLAQQRHAVVALPRHQAGGPGDISLSPGTLHRARGVERVVLPSPNGSTIAHALDEAGATVVAGCLRNATAVGRWVAATGRPVLVVAAGERWPDGSLRPAAEDLWGAGAVLAAVSDAVGHAAHAPEATLARDAYLAVAGDLPALLAQVASGLELIGRGFGEDVEIAGEVDASAAVPVLTDGAFVAYGRPTP